MRKVSDLNTKKRTVASFLTEEELRALQLKQQAELQREQEEQSRQNQNNGGVLGGVGYALEKVGLGLLSGLEGIWDYTAGGLAKLFGADDWAEQQISEDWLDYNHADDWFNPSEGWKVAGDVAGGIGTSLPSLGAVVAGAAIAAASGGTLAPLAGMAIAGGVAGLGSAGRSTKEAYDKTGELTGNEFGYGALVGLTEGTMEGVSSLIGAGSGTVIKNMTKSFGKEVAKSATRQTVIKGIAKGFAGEAFEEGVQAIIEPYYKRLTYDPNAQNATVQEVAYAALVGGLSGAIMGGADVSVRNAHSAVRGNSLVQNGKSGDVISMAEQISNYQAVNGTDYQSFQLVQNTLAELQESLKKTNGQIETVKQKMLVGVLEQANTNAAFAPIVTTSAENIYNNADVIAAKLNELGYADVNGKPFQITAEQLKEGIDTTNAKTLRKTMSKALKTNSALRTLAVADAVGKLMLDTAKYKDATLLGKQLSSQADLNRFIEQATDAERQAIAEKFGIDNWETLTNDVLQSKITEFVANGGVESYQNERSLIQETESVAPQTAKKILPRMVNLKNDGIYRYTQGSTDIAVIKRGDSYYVYDYESKRMSKPLSRTEINKVLREIHTNEANYTESVRQHNEVQNKLKEQAVELDNYARENITDYKNLSANGQASIRAVIRQGRSFGIQEDFILSCARVSARSGLSIVYSMEESFVAANGTYADGAIDLVNNRIIINPEAKSRTGESILIHELTHAIYNTTNGKLKIAKGVETMTNTEKERIRKRYAKVSKGDVSVIADEINAHFAEQTLSNKNILKRLVEKTPNVKKNILDFFKKAKAEYNGDKKLSGASARLYRQYKKLFDEFAARNQRYLGVENASSEARAQVGTQNIKAYALIGKNEHGIEVYKTGEAVKKLTFTERKKEFLRIMAQEYRGRTAKFNKNGVVFYAKFDSVDVKKNVYGDKKSDNKGYKAKINTGADGNVFELVENSQYRGSSVEQEGKTNSARKGVKSWDYFIKQVQIDGQFYDLVANIRKVVGDEFVYSIQLNESKKTVASPLLSSQQGEHQNRAHNATDNIISKKSEKVNPHERRLGKDDKRYAITVDGETVTGVAEETKNLIALHNLSEEKLLKVLELGGFPMPSIAITKADMEHSDFGNITIVFGKETIDPQANTANKVYTGDAWTPIVPQKEYLLKDSALVAPIEHLKEKLNAEYSGYYHDIKRFFDQYRENNGEYVISEKGLDNIGNVAYNNTGMLAAYLVKQRKKAEPQFTERYYNAVNERFIADELASIVDIIGEDNIRQANEYAEQEEIAQKYFDDIKSLFVEKKSSKLKSEISFVRKSAELSIQEFDIIDAQEIVRMLSYDYLSHGAVKEYDHYATREKLQKSVDVTAFYEWVKTIFTDSVQAVGMDNNSDIFDRYGNRRSFKQRHSAYTLNGIITAMKARKNIGNGFIVSENELAARLKKSFKSIEDIRNTRDILKRESDESYTQTRKMSADMLQEIVSSMTDSWEYQDNAREVIGELADKGYTSATKILSYLNKEYKGVYTFSANTAQKIELLFNVLQKYPTTYFEAKPQRAVYLDEIKSVILPSNTSQTLTETLRIKNVPYQFYNEQENRTDIIKKMDSVKFALPKKDSSVEKSYSGYSVGQRAKFSANNTAMRVYTKAEAREVINSIIEERLVFDDKGLYGELSGKDIKEVTDYLFAKLNTVKEGYRGNAALKIADFIIDNTVLTDMINDSSVSEAMSALSILRRYMHRLDLKGIKGEIENRYDKKNNISHVWGAKEGGIAPDTLPQMLAEDGIVIESINESDIFFEMLQMYNNAKAKVNEKTKQIKLSEIGDAKGLKDLRQQIARDILLAYDNKGSKSKYAKLVEKYTAQIARLRTELRESNTQNKLINSIIERAQKMRELKLGTFLNASEYKSDVFKQSVETLSKLKYRGNFNISGTRKVMADLKTWYTKENPVLTDSYEQVIADMLDTLSIGTKNYTTADLQMINYVMAYFTNYVEKFNKVYRNGKWIDAMPEATRYIGTIHDNEQVKSGWLMKHVGEPYMQTLSDPMSVVRRMDKYENGFYTESLEQLRESSIDSEIAEMEVKEDYEAFLKKNKNYLAEATKLTVKYHEVEMPKINLIGLYMTLKRNHAIAGLAENGFAFTDNKGKRVRVQGLNTEIVEDSDLRAFAIEEQLNIAELLSNTDKEYIAILEKAYNQDAKNLKAERDMQRLGFTNATEDYYYPIRRGNIAKNVDVSDIQSELDRVSNASFNKDTVHGAKQELYIESADIVFNRHVKAVCRYAKLSPAIDTFNRLYNLDISGNPNKPVSVATESANTWVKGSKYFSKLISDIQGIPSSSSEGMKALGYIRGSYAKFQLGANPKVWLTQLSSLFASSSMLDVDSISRGMFVSSKDIDTYCPIAKLRNNDNTAAMAQGVLDKVGKVSNVLMSPIGKMDRFVVRRLFGACQIQVSKKGGAKIGTTANKVEAGKLLKNVILETQQNSIATERSAAMRSGNELLRTITMFTADSMKVVGRVIDAVGEYSVLRSKLRHTSDVAVKETLNKRINTAKKKVGKSITALVTSALFMASIAQLFKWLYDKDRDEDETIAQEVLVDFTGNLIGGLPILKDIYARLVEGYTVDNYAYSSINDLLNSTSRLFKGIENLFSGNATEQEIAAGVKSLSYSVGQIFGIPTRNLYNVFYGLTKRFSPTTAYKIDEKFYKKNYVADLNKAIENDDSDMVAMLMNQRIGNVDMSDTVRNKLTELYGKGYSVLPRVIGETITYKNTDIQLSEQEYNRFKSIYSLALKDIENLFKNSSFNNLPEEKQAKAIKQIYDAYYNNALTELVGVDERTTMGELSQWIDMSKLAIAFAGLSDISSVKNANGKTIAGSKKKNTIDYLLKQNSSDGERLLILSYQGYSIQDGDYKKYSAQKSKSLLLKYIFGLRTSQEQKAQIAQKCGFRVRNGKIIRENY